MKRYRVRFHAAFNAYPEFEITARNRREAIALTTAMARHRQPTDPAWRLRAPVITAPEITGAEPVPNEQRDDKEES